MVGSLGEVILAVVAAGESCQDGIGIMAVVAVSHGTNQGCLVHPLSEPGQVLADLKTGKAGRDRTKLTADFERGFGLHVEHVEVAGPTEQVQENDRPRAARCPS